MKKKETRVNRDFQVTCVWCGKRIRRDETENSYAECLQCFYRILSERLSSQPRVPLNQFVSDR